MNPFDPGVAGALHAVSSRAVARRGGHEIRGQWFPLFYNPMWGCFGDRTEGPPGSYYLHASKPLNYYWNLYDQVLLRPGLMDLLQEVRVLEDDGQTSLLTRHGLPDGSAGSDHLPVLFRLDL
jgi:hypothetical protein